MHYSHALLFGLTKLQLVEFNIKACATKGFLFCFYFECQFVQCEAQLEGRYHVVQEGLVFGRVVSFALDRKRVLVNGEYGIFRLIILFESLILTVVIEVHF